MTLSNQLRILLLFIAIMTSTASYCQLKKGNLLLGGSMGFTISETEITQLDPTTGNTSSSIDKVFGINFNPDIAYFITQGLALGISVPLSYSKTDSPNSDLKTTSYGFGPTIRYYFQFGSWAVFPEFNYLFRKYTLNGPTFSPTTGTIVDSKTNVTSNTVKIGAGLAYFLNKNIGIEGVLSYNHNKTDDERNYSLESKVSSINFNVGLQIYLSR